MKTLKGSLQNWQWNKEKKYVTVDVPYGKARSLFKADIYDAITHTGEQRPEIIRQVRLLKKAIENDNYTPNGFTASVTNHVVRYEKNQAVVEVEDDNPLALTNGFQRFTALERLRSESKAYQQKVDQLPISCLVILDPDRKKDFVNSNRNAPINKTHMFNLMVDSDAVDKGDPALVKFARDVAQKLNGDSRAFIHNMIDMSGFGKSILRLSSLTSSHASEQVQSLYGLAKVAREMDKDVDWAVEQVVDVWQMLREDAPDLLLTGQVLTPPPAGRARAVPLLIGMTSIWAYRQKLMGQPTENDRNLFIKAALNVMDDVSTEMTMKEQRRLLGDFAASFFEDLQENDSIPVGFHCGLPIILLKTFNAGSFGREALPKEKGPPKKRGRKKKEPAAPVTQEEIISTDDEELDNAEDSDMSVFDNPF